MRIPGFTAFTPTYILLTGCEKSSLTLFSLLVRRALDVALKHAVFEALLFVNRLGDVVEGHDPEQRPPVLHRNIARVPLEHQAAQLHHVDVRRRNQWIPDVDVIDLEIAELSLALGQRVEDFGKGQHSHHLPVVHDHQRADVVLRHRLHCFEHGPVRRRREQRVTLDAGDFTDQHGSPPEVLFPSFTPVLPDQLTPGVGRRATVRTRSMTVNEIRQPHRDLRENVDEEHGDEHHEQERQRTGEDLVERYVLRRDALEVVAGHRHRRGEERRLDVQRHQDAEKYRVDVEVVQQRQEDRHENDDDLGPLQRPTQQEEDELGQQHERHRRHVEAEDEILDDTLPAQVREYRGERPRADEQPAHHRCRARGEENRFLQALEVELSIADRQQDRT